MNKNSLSKDNKTYNEIVIDYLKKQKKTQPEELKLRGLDISQKGIEEIEKKILENYESNENSLTYPYDKIVAYMRLKAFCGNNNCQNFFEDNPQFKERKSVSATTEDLYVNTIYGF